MVGEEQLQQQVADYLRLQYPDVIFHSDYGSGIKLTPSQAAMQKRQNGGRRAWPDMFVAERKTSEGYLANGYIRPLNGGFEYEGYCIGEEFILWQGLFLELKKDGTRLKKKNGDWATDHIAEQAEVLQKLRDRGYCAEFAVGFDEAKRIIDEYLGG